MEYKKSRQGKFLVLPGALLICIIVTLNNFYFISNVAQNIFYGIYACLVVVTTSILHKRSSIRIHHGYLIMFNLLLIYVTYMNHFIALPLLLLYPLFCCEKSHWVFKIFSILSYGLIIIVMLLALFVRLVFTSTTMVKQIDSPNNKYSIEVYSIDEGALGGATKVKLIKKYCNLVKRERYIYFGRYGEEDTVKWIDNTHIEVNSKSIDITSR